MPCSFVDRRRIARRSLAVSFGTVPASGPLTLGTHVLPGYARPLSNGLRNRIPGGIPPSSSYAVADSNIPGLNATIRGCSLMLTPPCLAPLSIYKGLVDGTRYVGRTHSVDRCATPSLCSGLAQIAETVIDVAYATQALSMTFARPADSLFCYLTTDVEELGPRRLTLPSLLA